MTIDNDRKRMEDALKNAFRRQSPPDGFADRILARVAKQNSVQSRPGQRDSWLRLFAQPLRWAAAGALAAALVAGGIHYRQVQYKAEHERVEGEAAKQRLMLALRIASSKLQLAKSKVYEINAGQTENRDEKE